jgi:hypothetical protein
MPKPTRNKSPQRAVRQALARLGMQARADEIVAHLARYEIAVSETLVQRVRLEMLRKISDQRKPPLKSLDQRSHLRRPQKIPARRK